MTELFFQYITKKFLIELEQKRKMLDQPNARCLLILDSHNSRASSRTMDALANANVDCLSIPAHSSHIVQPLDRTVNAKFKQFFTKYKVHLNNVFLLLIHFALSSHNHRRTIIEKIYWYLSTMRYTKPFGQALFELDSTELEFTRSIMIKLFHLTTLAKVHLHPSNQQSKIPLHPPSLQDPMSRLITRS